VNVLLTFDIEVWCNSWTTLEEDFPTSFERYVFGRSKKGDFALPKTLEILDRHGLRGVFFVEPLFAARFGLEPLATIVELIQQAGQEIQLHLHPEWTDEALSPLLPNVTTKRQHLSYYSGEEQAALIRHGLRLLNEAGAPPPSAFRSGSFACNEDTFAAIAANGLRFDSSINRTLPVSLPGNAQPASAGLCEPFAANGLGVYPMTIFRDGFGRLRHAQIGACSTRELIEAMQCAQADGWPSFIALSHNFELMVPDKVKPDPIVVGRFEALCRFLANHRDTLPTKGFNDLSLHTIPRGLALPHTSRLSTAVRYAEQALRRLN